MATAESRAAKLLREVAEEEEDGAVGFQRKTEDVNVERRRWERLQQVDFIEAPQDGNGCITTKVAEMGLKVGDPVGHRSISYERVWTLDRPEDQANAAWLLTERLRPKVIHIGLPTDASDSLVKFAL